MQYHVKGRTTELKALWYDTALCVKCGTELEAEQVRTSLDRGLPPCCGKCAKAVKEHVTHDTSASWPTARAHPVERAWQGGWVKDVASDRWRQE